MLWVTEKIKNKFKKADFLSSASLFDRMSPLLLSQTGRMDVPDVLSPPPSFYPSIMSPH